jgi:hypothetical protein
MCAGRATSGCQDHQQFDGQFQFAKRCCYEQFHVGARWWCGGDRQLFFLGVIIIFFLIAISASGASSLQRVRGAASFKLRRENRYQRCLSLTARCC